MIRLPLSAQPQPFAVYELDTPAQPSDLTDAAILAAAHEFSCYVDSQQPTIRGHADVVAFARRVIELHNAKLSEEQASRISKPISDPAEIERSFERDDAAVPA